MKTISKKQLRAVTILVRYFIKATQAVVLYVENDKGARYYVRLQENGVHTCNCKATKECYHITACVALEQARPFAAKSLPVWTTELVKTGKLVIPGKARIIKQAVEAVVPVKKDMMKAALTTNEGFQLMR
jgi:hypothetical protein